MKHDLVNENIYELKTPVGTFTVKAEDKLLPFSVAAAKFNYPVTVYDSNNNETGEITTENNYIIKIATKTLETGKDYVISFSAGTWDFFSSDEYRTCYGSIIDGYAIGIGAFDPNDYKKDKQLINHLEQSRRSGCKEIEELESFDESNFEKYTVCPLKAKNGYTFKLFDFSEDYIQFNVAWVKIEQYEQSQYEDAIGFLLT